MSKKTVVNQVPELHPSTSVGEESAQIPISIIEPARNEVQQQIRELAYQLYEQRGREDGAAEQDWIQAESIILGQNQKMAA